MLGAILSSAGILLGAGKLSVLVYHRVLDAPDPLRPGEPTVEQFEWQVGLIARRFNPLPLGEAVTRLYDGALPPNAVAVTFDDGYRSTLAKALPVLRRHNVPATVFVATEFSNGTNMWNDRLTHLFGDPSRESLLIDGKVVSLGTWAGRRQVLERMLSSLKYRRPEERTRSIDKLYDDNRIAEEAPLMMSRKDLQEAARGGLAIGGHTVSHPILAELPRERQLLEIAENRKTLESWIQEPVKLFAYPNGKYGRDFDDTSVDVVREVGYEAAVTTDWGVSTCRTSPWRLHRFTPWDRTPHRFHARLLMNLRSAG
jgi:peptidoglycan/xylan/chitin deacetylase (PgdA/CDA1 family)